MTYRTLFFQILATLLIGTLPCITIAGQRQLPMSMQNMEKEIEEANRAIEEYIASLPPAEQAEFNRQVEAMTQMFENMSDEEFEKLLGDMFNEESMPLPDFSQMPEPLFEEAVVEAPQLNVEQLKKFETAVAVINDIIKQSNMFMVLINSSPGLSNRINKWGNSGLISDWQPGATWETLKIDLEYFIQKLYKIQDQDLTTKEYKYLSDILADEALYNNIIQLRTQLNILLPIINVPEFGIQKISSQSKETIQNVLKKYTEGFYVLTIPKALDSIFEKYEPQAKKIREAESAATRRAQEALKEPRTPAEWTEAGVESESGYDSGYGSYGGYDDYSPYYGGGYDSGYSPYYGGGGYDDSGSSYGDFGRRSGGGDGSGGGARSGGSPLERFSEDKKNEEKATKEKEEAGEYIPSDEIAELIGKIKGDLERINTTLTGEDYPQLKDLATHVSTQEVNADLANYILPTVIDKNVIALTDNIKQIEKLSKKLNKTTLTTYQKEIKKTFNDKNKKDLEKLSKDLELFKPLTEAEIKAAEARRKTAPITAEEEAPKKVDVDKLSLEKKYAYFADEKAKEELEADDSELVKKVVHPKDIRKIKENIDNLFKEVNAFGNLKAIVKPVAKKPAVAVEVPATE